MPQAQRVVQESEPQAKETTGKLFLMPESEPKPDTTVKVRLVSRGSGIAMKFTISRA